MTGSALARLVALVLAALPFVGAGGPLAEASRPLVPVAAVGEQPIASLGDRCLPFSGARIVKDGHGVSNCRPEALGTLGTVGGWTYYYVLYCLSPNYPGDVCESVPSPLPEGTVVERARAVAVFVGREGAGTAALLYERATVRGDNPWSTVFSLPAIVTNDAGTFLVLTIAADGASDLNESEYYRWNPGDGTWLPVDFDQAQWEAELQKHAPAGTFAGGSGLWPDLKHMTLDAWYSHPEDPPCCPTGGAVHVDLAFEDNRFRFASIVVDDSNGK